MKRYIKSTEEYFNDSFNEYPREDKTAKDIRRLKRQICDFMKSNGYPRSTFNAAAVFTGELILCKTLQLEGNSKKAFKIRVYIDLDATRPYFREGTNKYVQGASIYGVAYLPFDIAVDSTLREWFDDLFDTLREDYIDGSIPGFDPSILSRG